MRKKLLGICLGLALGAGATAARADDTVENRRQFDAQGAHVGVLTGLAVPGASLGIYLEGNVWDRLALGVAGGVGLSGPSGGGYARLRPIVWGGSGESVLSAVTIEAGYAYMMYGGGDPFVDVQILPCMAEDGCDRPTPHYVSVPAHVAAVSLGLEHSTKSGFTFRYGVGWGHLLATPQWRCEIGGSPYRCNDSVNGKPTLDFLTLNFGFSHSLPSW